MRAQAREVLCDQPIDQRGRIGVAALGPRDQREVEERQVAHRIVPSVEACLPFYVERLGFTQTVDVPDEDKLGFVILKRGAVELMMQSRASVAADIAGLDPDGFRAALYIEVDQLAPIRKALEG